MDPYTWEIVTMPDRSGISRVLKDGNSAIGIIGALGVCFVGATVTYVELADKPTDDEVQVMIETALEPVRGDLTEIHGQTDTLHDIGRDIERIKKRQRVQMMRNMWRDDKDLARLQHRPRPGKPRALTELEAELIE